MDSSEILLRAFAFRLALLVVAMFAARNLQDGRHITPPEIETAGISYETTASVADDAIAGMLRDMALHD